MSLSDDARAAQILGRIHYLQAADGVWTIGAARSQPEHLEALGIVRDQLMTTIAALKEDVPFIISVGERLGDDGLENVLSQPGLPEEVAASFRALAERGGGFAEFTKTRLEMLDGLLSSKRETIAADYERVRAGGPRGVSGGADPDACAWGIAIAILAGPISPAASAGGVVLAILSC